MTFVLRVSYAYHVSTKKRDEALERAIEAAGGVAALARFINDNSPEEQHLTSQAISQWATCPPSRVLIVERASADQAGAPRVTRQQLRPDMYPSEQAA